ncbi:MAG: diguanylate cyclase domain-containing protein [Spirochaetota bacterium]
MTEEKWTRELISLLRDVDLFSELNTDELATIVQWSDVIHAEESQALFSRGDPGNALFIVVTGSVIISQSEGKIRATDIAEYIRGEYFGDIDLFGGGLRTASARLAEKSSVLRFPAEGLQLRDVLETTPSLSARLLHRFISVVAGRIRETNSLISQNTPWVQELRKQVYGDKLTGLFNRAYLSEELPRLIDPDHAPVASVMIKPDNFKKLNDTYGHESGDAILRRIAATVRGWSGDNPAIRYRGNEMVALIPECGVEQARTRGEDIRQALSALDISDIVSGVERLGMPFTVGIAVYPDHAQEGMELVTRSSETLFAARDAGGDRTAVYGDHLVSLPITERTV